MITLVKVEQCFLVFGSVFCFLFFVFFVVYCLWYFSAKTPFSFFLKNVPMLYCKVVSQEHVSRTERNVGLSRISKNHFTSFFLL